MASPESSPSSGGTSRRERRSGRRPEPEGHREHDTAVSSPENSADDESQANELRPLELMLNAENSDAANGHIEDLNALNETYNESYDGAFRAAVNGQVEEGLNAGKDRKEALKAAQEYVESDAGQRELGRTAYNDIQPVLQQMAERFTGPQTTDEADEDYEARFADMRHALERAAENLPEQWKTEDGEVGTPAPAVIAAAEPQSRERERFALPKGPRTKEELERLMESDTPEAALYAARAKLAEASYNARAGKMFSTERGREKALKAAEAEYLKARRAYLDEQLQEFLSVAENMNATDEQIADYMAALADREDGMLMGEEANHYLSKETSKLKRALEWYKGQHKMVQIGIGLGAGAVIGVAASATAGGAVAGAIIGAGRLGRGYVQREANRRGTRTKQEKWQDATDRYFNEKYAKKRWEQLNSINEEGLDTEIARTKWLNASNETDFGADREYLAAGNKEKRGKIRSLMSAGGLALVGAGVGYGIDHFDDVRGFFGGDNQPERPGDGDNDNGGEGDNGRDGTENNNNDQDDKEPETSKHNTDAAKFIHNGEFSQKGVNDFLTWVDDKEVKPWAKGADNSTIWGFSEQYLIDNGVPNPTNAQIDAVKDQMVPKFQELGLADEKGWLTAGDTLDTDVNGGAEDHNGGEAGGSDNNNAGGNGGEATGNNGTQISNNSIEAARQGADAAAFGEGAFDGGNGTEAQGAQDLSPGDMLSEQGVIMGNDSMRIERSVSLSEITPQLDKYFNVDLSPAEYATVLTNLTGDVHTAGEQLPTGTYSGLNEKVNLRDYVRTFARERASI